MTDEQRKTIEAAIGDGYSPWEMEPVLRDSIEASLAEIDRLKAVETDLRDLLRRYTATVDRGREDLPVGRSV